MMSTNTTPDFSSDADAATTLNKLLNGYIEKNTVEVRARLAEVLGLDEMNLAYFLALYEQKKSAQPKLGLRIFEEGHKHDGPTAYPTAIAPLPLLKHLPVTKFSDLKKNEKAFQRKAKECAVWIKKTHGGGGTSVLRDAYLARIQNVAAADVKLGAKGTDLFVSVEGHEASLAEAQMLQTLADLNKNIFNTVFLHDIVSSESADALAALWNKKSLIDPASSYLDLTKKIKGFHRSGQTFQSVIPTLDGDGLVTLKRKAPGGHGFFAVETLLGAVRGAGLPDTGERALISVIGNGEDLGSTPDSVAIGWMLEEKIPIVMITTDKTEIDLKGGQIALVQTPEKETYVALLEQAQAREAGQAELFEKLGLNHGLNGAQKSPVAYFNTNVALFNYAVLVPKLKKLVEKMGELEFVRAITPTLIENKKSQKDADGVERVYEQLEGAMGSTLLNLDRLWRREFNEPFVHFLNVERQHRTQFFSPIKTAFDFYMQFFSDRFKLDTNSMRLINQRPGSLPAVQLANKTDKNYYGEVLSVLRIFQGCQIRELDALTVSGPVNFANSTLKGKIKITNESSTPYKVSGVVANKTITISPQGEAIES